MALREILPSVTENYPAGPPTYLPMVLGLVHDFNSALTLVLGQLSLLEDLGPFSAAQAEQVHSLRQAVEHATALPRHLLALARGAAPDARRVELRGLVLGVERLLRGRMGPNTRLTLRLGEGPAWVRGDARQLTRVLINLASNALEAMPHGGELTLGLQGHQDRVRLTVEDTGPGLAPEVLSRLFEPLVSTRADRGGSGLGLYVVAQLVREHGGRITCHSQPGTGARFDIELPALEVAVIPSAVAAPLAIVIERDPGVRQMACTILELARWAPRGFASLEEARAAAEPVAGQTRAVLLDRTACRDDNLGELGRLLALAPDAGVVLTAPDRAGPGPVRDGMFHTYLAKPYSAIELVSALRTALAAVTG